MYEYTPNPNNTCNLFNVVDLHIYWIICTYLEKSGWQFICLTNSIVLYTVLPCWNEVDDNKDNLTLYFAYDMTHLLTKRSQYNIHNQRSLTYLFAYTKREILHGTKISASYIKMKSSTEIKQFLDLKNECKFEFIFIHQRAGCTTRQTFNLSKEILKVIFLYK